VSYTNGLVVYSVKSDVINNYEVKQTITVHHLGEIPQGSGTFPIWEHINDLVMESKLENYDDFVNVMYAVVSHETVGKIKDGTYNLTEWLRVKDDE